MWCAPPISANRSRVTWSSASFGTPGGVGATTNQRTCTLPLRGPRIGFVAPRSFVSRVSSVPDAASSQISKSPPRFGSPNIEEGPPSRMTTDLPLALSPVITRRMDSWKDMVTSGWVSANDRFVELVPEPHLDRGALFRGRCRERDDLAEIGRIGILVGGGQCPCYAGIDSAEPFHFLFQRELRPPELFVSVEQHHDQPAMQQPIEDPTPASRVDDEIVVERVLEPALRHPAGEREKDRNAAAVLAKQIAAREAARHH